MCVFQEIEEFSCVIMEMKYLAGWRIDSRWLEEERTYGRKWTKKESKYAPMHVMIVLLMEGNEWRKKITKAILAWKKERLNGYLDGMKTMFRMESPDDAGLTWMIEALRAGELSSHVGRVLERKEKKRKRKRHTIDWRRENEWGCDFQREEEWSVRLRKGEAAIFRGRRRAGYCFQGESDCV